MEEAEEARKRGRGEWSESEGRGRGGRRGELVLASDWDYIYVLV